MCPSHASHQFEKISLITYFAMLRAVKTTSTKKTSPVIMHIEPSIAKVFQGAPESLDAAVAYRSITTPPMAINMIIPKMRIASSTWSGILFANRSGSVMELHMMMHGMMIQ